jgi:hypothetical protein
MIEYGGWRQKIPRTNIQAPDKLPFSGAKIVVANCGANMGTFYQERGIGKGSDERKMKNPEFRIQKTEFNNEWTRAKAIEEA